MVWNSVGKTGIRRRAILLLILLIFSTCPWAAGATRYEMPMDKETTVTEPPVIFESGTAGSSIIYMNSTSASVTVDSLVTTFYPNGYSIITGSYGSGSTPSSVSAVDSEYLTVDGAGTDASSSSYYPGAYNLVGGTSNVSGSVENLTSDDGVRMEFQSYLSRDVTLRMPSTTTPSMWTPAQTRAPHLTSRLSASDRMANSTS